MVVPLSLEFFCLIILIIPEKCVLSVTKSHKYSFAWGILIEKKRKEEERIKREAEVMKKLLEEMLKENAGIDNAFLINYAGDRKMVT